VTIRLALPVDDEQAARELWYDTRRWPTFMDGFRTVVRQDPEWPEGGVVIWDSGPHHQGRTREAVVAPDVVEIETEQLRGRRSVHFAGGEMTVAFDYELKRSNPIQAFFVKRALRDSLERTLYRFAIELGGA
jgi:hypothetical protein